MTLGDLEFTAEDAVVTIGDWPTPVISIDRANALLRERLGKAPVWYRHNEGSGFGSTTCYRPHLQYHDGRRIPGREARLVCIEEGKPLSEELKSRSQMQRAEVQSPGTLIAEIERMRAENQRLRKALERAHPLVCNDEVDDRCYICRALEGK